MQFHLRILQGFVTEFTYTKQKTNSDSLATEENTTEQVTEQVTEKQSSSKSRASWTIA